MRRILRLPRGFWRSTVTKVFFLQPFLWLFVSVTSFLSVRIFFCSSEVSQPNVLWEYVCSFHYQVHPRSSGKKVRVRPAKQVGSPSLYVVGWCPNGGSKSETIEPYPALGTVKIEKIEFLRANFKIPHPRNKQEQRVPSVSGVLPAIFNGPFGSPDLPKASRHFMAMAMRHFCSWFLHPKIKPWKRDMHWYCDVHWYFLICSTSLGGLQIKLTWAVLESSSNSSLSGAATSCHGIGWRLNAGCQRMLLCYGWQVFMDPVDRMDYGPPRKSNYTVWNEMQ